MTTMTIRSAAPQPRGWRFWLPLAVAFSGLIVLNSCFGGLSEYPQGDHRGGGAAGGDHGRVMTGAF